MNVTGIINSLTLIFIIIIIGNVQLHTVEDLPVRVIHGNGYQGTVQVFDTKASSWYFVCRDTWDDKAANVICNMLGFTRVSGEASANSYSSVGWRGNVSCNGDERFLADCPITYTKERSCVVADVDCSKSGIPDNFFIFAGQYAIDRVDSTTWAYIEITSSYHDRIRGLSYADATDSIYWVNGGIKRLSARSGRLQTLSLNLHYKHYTGLTLDNSKRLAFFGVEAHIHGGLWKLQFKTNGQPQANWIMSGSFTHLQADPYKGKLYWFDANKHQIREADYNGKNIQVVMSLKKISSDKIAFVLDAEHIYVTFVNKGNILVHERYGKKEYTIYITKYKGYKSVTQWNDYLYLALSHERRLLRVKKDGSLVQLVGPPLEKGNDLRRIMHYSSRQVDKIKVKINEGASGVMGTVKVYDNTMSKWLSVCSDTFGYREAKVVCRMLGYTSEQNVAKSGQGNGHGWNMDITCRGDEADLRYCRLRAEKPRKCDFVGLKCLSSSEKKLHAASLSTTVIVVIVTTSVTIPPLIIGVIVFILRRCWKHQYREIIPLKEPEESDQLQRDTKELLALATSQLNNLE